MVDTESTVRQRVSRDRLRGCQQPRVITTQLVGDARHKRRYPDGPVSEMTPEWKAAVEARLDEWGKTKAWLADQVGVDKSAITVMLRPATMTSRLVKPVSLALKLDEPVIGVDSESNDVLLLVSQLTPESRALAINLLKSLPKKAE